MAGPTPIRQLEETDSTNAEAARLFEQRGADGPLWLLARRQTAGKGRRGRSWFQGEGNFAGTLLWPVAREGLKIPCAFAFMAALAVAEAAEAHGVPADRLALKWPNDVLLDGRKLAGILCELLTRGDAHALAIGIGVNLEAVPEEASDIASSVAHAISGAPPSAERFGEALDARFRSHWRAFEGEGFAVIRAAWLKRAAGLNAPLTVRQDDSRRDGRFHGIAENGALLLEEGGKITPITAGDVFLGSGKD